MSDTTQEVVAEAPESDKVEVTVPEGVETQEAQPQAEETPQPEESVQTEEEQEIEAEESLLKVLMNQKGFKSEEDLAKAYAELEKHNTRTSQEKANLEKLVDAMIEEGEEEETFPDDISSFVRAQVEREVAPFKAQSDAQKVAAKFPDIYEYGDKMKEVFDAYPDAKTAFKGEKGIELLYKIAKAEEQEALLTQAREEGRQEVTEAELSKIRGQVANGTKAKQAGEHIYTRAEIAAMTPEEFVQKEAEITRQANSGLIK